MQIFETIGDVQLGDYQIFASAEYDKQLSKVAKKDRALIEKKMRDYVIPQLKQEPHYGKNIKQLRDYSLLTWRYRIGNYRVFYEINEETKEIDILTVKLRSKAY